MPFSDPMADGPAIQASSLRALNNGATLSKTLDLVRGFAEQDDETPIILMGYYQPDLHIRRRSLLRDAKDARCRRVDHRRSAAGGRFRALHSGDRRRIIRWIRWPRRRPMRQRLPKVLNNASGFVYYVSILGITGTASVPEEATANAVDYLKSHTDLPVAVGFGIKTPEMAANHRSHRRRGGCRLRHRRAHRGGTGR